MSNFSNFLIKLEKSYGFLPEIYVKIDDSYKISEVKYFDILTGSFRTDDNPDWTIDELFTRVKLNNIWRKLKNGRKSDLFVSENIQLLSGNKEKYFEIKFMLNSGAVYSVIRESTEKKRNEESILILNQALDATSDTILITDKVGIITYVNPAFLKLYGYKADEIIGKVTPRILKSSKTKAEQYNDFWNGLLSQKSMQVEIKNKTKNGREVYIEGTADSIISSDGEIIGFLEIQRDVTDKKISLNYLKQSESKFRSVWEKSLDGMRLTNKDGKIISVNEAFCRLVEMPEKKLLKKTFDIIYKHTDQEHEAKMSEYIKAFAEKKFVNFRWNNFVLHNGKSVFLNVSFSYIDFDHETLLLSIFRDVTKYKKSEDELRNAERLATIGTMAAYLSHEIKNPLATIKNYVEILFENEKLTDDIRETLVIIHDTVKRLNKLLTDVLQYAKSEDLIEVDIDTNVLINNVVNSLKRRLKEKNIEVKNLIKNVKIRGDYMSLISACTNLIENSIEAVSENGEIIISAKNNKAYSSIVFKDNGCGVEADKKIFEPFITTKSTGTGLGLAIASKIMKYHNGEIDLVSSKPGETIFELKFFKKGANGKDPDN